MKKLILIILTLFTGGSSANYADIGSNKGLSLDLLVRVDGPYYISGSKGDNHEYAGVGIGYKIKALNMVITASTGSVKSLEFHAMYNDRGIPVFISFGQSDKRKVLYKIGVGYPINEKVGLIVHHSDKGLFVGVRRWL